MSFVVACPKCSKRLKVKDEARGGRVRCPECREPIDLEQESVDNEQRFDEPVNKGKQPEERSRGKKARASRQHGANLWLIGGVGAALLVLVGLGVGGYVLWTQAPGSSTSAATAIWVKHSEPGLLEIETPAAFGPNRDTVGKKNVRGVIARHDGIEYFITIIQAPHYAASFTEGWTDFKTRMRFPKFEERPLGAGEYEQGGFQGCEFRLNSHAIEDFQFWLRDDRQIVLLCVKYPKDRAEPKAARDRFFGSAKLMRMTAEEWNDVIENFKKK